MITEYTIASLKEGLKNFDYDRDALISCMMGNKDMDIYSVICSLFKELYERYSYMENCEGSLLKDGILALKAVFEREHYDILYRSGNYERIGWEEAVALQRAKSQKEESEIGIAQIAKRNEEVNSLYVTTLTTIVYPILLEFQEEERAQRTLAAW